MMLLFLPNCQPKVSQISALPSKVPISQVVLLFRMQLWPVAHFFHSLLGGWFFSKREQARLSSSLFKKKIHPKVSENKWATFQSFIPKRSTTCKIGTLIQCQNFCRVHSIFCFLVTWSKNAFALYFECFMDFLI